MKFLHFMLLALCVTVAFGKPFEVTEEPECAGYNACHAVDNDKINVHIIPHSHDDVGWLSTVDQYFYKNVQYIISSVITSLQENPDRRFIQVETAYFYLWWNLQNDETKSQVVQLINEGRLEIANGAWSMNDEAAVHYQSTMDQFTLGLRFIEDVLGKCARPKIGWQIDPFGHSREHASLLSQMGMDAVFFSRIDYRDKNKRKDEKTMDLLWRGSANLGNDSTIFTSVLYAHYNAPSGFCFDSRCSDLPIVTNPDSSEYNWEERVEAFTTQVAVEYVHYPTDHFLITFGGDFMWQNAEQVFINIDKLIAGFEKFKPTIDGKEVNVFYSTPACYTKAVRDYVEEKKVELEVKTDDFFSYADGANTVWSGYFTSRATSKRLERVANNLLQVGKQITAIGGKAYGSVAKLYRALGVMQHHDAITGTEKEAVERDYHKQIVAGMEEAVSEISDSFSSILGLENFNLQTCLLANVSICSESNKDEFNVLIYNPLARTISHYVQIPVKDGTWKVTDPSGEEIETHLTNPARNFDYITEDIGEETLPKVLIFRAQDLPPLGYKVYQIERTSTVSSAVREEVLSFDQIGFDDQYVNFDLDSGLLMSITLNGVTLDVTQEILFYNGSTGVSGAYIFRSDTDVRDAVKFGYVQSSILINDGGNLVREVRQVWNEWVTQIIRVYNGEDFIEFDWIVGPIDLRDGHGKEVISRYSTQLNTEGVFYTDSNGREMIYRKKDYRPTYEYTNEEPQAGNYYPVNTKILIKDDVYEFAVLTDRSEGGSSLSSGEVELMLNRATMEDDKRGVGENLNETEYQQPLVARGTHFVTLGKSSDGNGGRTMAVVERDIALRKHLQPWLFYTTDDVTVKEQSFLNEELPSNVHLLTLEGWGDNALLIRLEHILEKEDDPELSQEVTVDLENLFRTFKISSMKEYTLAANTPLEESTRLSWSQIEDNMNENSPLNKQKRLVRDEEDLKITLAPMQIRTFVVNVEVQ